VRPARAADSIPVVPSAAERVLGSLLRRVSIDRFELAADHDETYFQDGFADTQRYQQRFDGHLSVAGRSVLDVGCGYGSSCFEFARQGAKRVLGIDIDAKFVAFAQDRLAREPRLAARLEFRHVDAQGADLGETFDLAISKDSFEHIADPERYLAALKRYVGPGGEIAIGFGPLWRSPYGAHQLQMSRLPWAHLIFPERVVMREWRRIGFPGGATTYAEIAGGLNKMTLGRFERVLEDPELERVFFATNQTTARSGRLLKTLARLPGAREACTFNVYALSRYRPRSDGGVPPRSRL
jgi:SAM-dependent methyltransferase